MTILTLNNPTVKRAPTLSFKQQIDQLQSKVQQLEQQHQDYKRSQQNLIGAIAEICISPMQEIEALRILIYKGEAEYRRYLRSLLINQNRKAC